MTMPTRRRVPRGGANAAATCCPVATVLPRRTIIPFSSCRCLLVVSLAMLWGAARGFILKPAASDIGRYDRRPCGIGTARIADNNAFSPRPRHSVCRPAGGEGPSEEEGGEGGIDRPEGDAESLSREPTEGSAVEASWGGDEAKSKGIGEEEGQEVLELTAEEKAKKEANIDWDDDDALLRAFPNLPKAPIPVLPDARDLTLEEMSEGEFDVSYRGQPSAKQAIEEFEREERKRIHLATARRVLRYNLVQQQVQDARESQELGSSTTTVVDEMIDDDIVGEDDRDPKWSTIFPWEGMVEADYEWQSNPQLITFSGFGVLYNWKIPLGNILRDAVGRAYGYLHRLPGPERFAFHFENSFKEAQYHMPCFGQRVNISSWDWWFHVFTDSYIKTMVDYDISEEIITDKIDVIANELFYEIMVGPEAFELVPHTKVVLDTLAAWKENGGPKLAVVANADERLNVTLENMGILPYFDFVLTSHEAGFKVNEVGLYDRALEIAGVESPGDAIHFGSDYDLDVIGPCKAGWDACLVKPRQSDYEQPEEIYQYHRLMRIGEVLHRFGLPGADMPILSRRRGNFWEEPDESVENNPDLLGA